MIREMICISCPVGCRLKVDASDRSNIKVTGNACRKGIEYGVNEVTAPKRMITGTVKIRGAKVAMLPVKTSQPLPKELIFPALELLHSVKISAPVRIGDIIYKDILGTGIDFIATRELL